MRLPTDMLFPEPGDGKGPHEREIPERLTRLDPHLAGLYQISLEFQKRILEPGMPMMLGHSGRELLRAVIDSAEGDGPIRQSAHTGDGGTKCGSKEDFPKRIGAAFSLGPIDPLVQAWNEVHKGFQKAAHYRGIGKAPDPKALDANFREFELLLFGFLKPFFPAMDDLERFLTLEDPTAEQVRKVLPYLVRPQLRHAFYANLKHPSWFPHLRSLGQFRNPPVRVDEPDGYFRTPHWPEAQFLLTMVPMEPTAVRDVLLEVPDGNDNPMVWHRVVEIACTLPGSISAVLVPKLVSAMKRKAVAPVLFPHTAIRWVQHLAEQGQPAAFDLLSCLLWSRNQPDPEKPGYEQVRYGFAEHPLARLEGHEVQELIKEALPALEGLDRIRTITTLAERLSSLLNVLDRVGSVPGHPGQSDSVWDCRWLDQDGSFQKTQGDLAVALARIVRRAGAQSPSMAQDAWKALIGKRRGHPIFARLRSNLLCEAGGWLQAELDATLADPDFLNRGHARAEAAELLRKRFNDASPAIRRTFVEGLERGPVVFREESTEEDKREVTQDWQVHRLRLFRGKVPDELQGMAKSLGIQGEALSEDDYLVNETGHGEPKFSWGGSRQSPIPLGSMATMSIPELLLALECTNLDEPFFGSLRTYGLGKVLREFAEGQPDKGILLFKEGVREGISLDFLSSILSGLRKRMGDKKDVDPQEVLSLLPKALDAMAGTPMDVRHNLLSEVIDTLESGCQENTLPLDQAAKVWGMIQILVESEDLWSEHPGFEGVDAFERLYSIGLNMAACRSVSCLIEGALWVSRHTAALGGVAETWLAQLPDLLDGVLAREGDLSLGALTILGGRLPWLLDLSPAWVQRNETRLFDHGIEDPLTHPAMGAYLTGVGLFVEVFKNLRPWYATAARSANLLPASQREKHGSITEALGRHVLIALICGACGVGDPDAIVETCFSNLPASEKDSIYWTVYRSWSGESDPPPVEQVQRLIQFWEWRLDQLERQPAKPDIGVEAQGLLWFLATPHIPVEDAIRCARRTLALHPAGYRVGSLCWPRLAELSGENPVGTFPIVESLIEMALKEEHGYLPMEYVLPCLRAALACDDPGTRARAKELVNRLGERGYPEARDLLPRSG
jgi:hypothetical protein